MLGGTWGMFGGWGVLVKDVPGRGPGVTERKTNERT